MLFNIIKFGQGKPALRTLILNYAGVKIDSVKALPQGITYPNESVIVDGLLSADQVAKLSKCGGMTIDERIIKNDTYVSYSYHSGCM